MGSQQIIQINLLAIHLQEYPYDYTIRPSVYYLLDKACIRIVLRTSMFCRLHIHQGQEGETSK